jgi:lysophospholipase L1-like esterase
MSEKSWLPTAYLIALTWVSFSAEAAGWTTSWGAAPLAASPAAGPFPATPTFSDQTIRQVVHLSAGGSRLRVRFTNEFGSRPLRIGAVRIALADATGKIQPGTDRPLSFAGKPGALIPVGSPYLSDPVDFAVKALSALSISIYLPEDTGPCTCHGVALQTGFISNTGNFVTEAFAPKATFMARAFVSGVEVYSAAPAKAVVVLGDSISDGVGSTPDSNHRWPDLFAQRLAARRHEAWGVVNMGISGNRVLDDGAGQSAIARFDRDVLSVPGVAYVIVFEGVNDIGISFGQFQGPLVELFKSMVPKNKATAEAMIAGYRQLIERAHAKGLKILGATIAPYEGSAYYSPEGESIRQQINAWFRTGGAFDGVLDFDAVLRDPDKPTQIATPLHAGDHLHGSDLGYEAIARSIDLSQFK